MSDIETTRPEGKYPDPVDVQVGANIRARRKQLDLSQEKVAKELNISFQQIQKYERGHNRVSASMLFGMARVLRCTVADLFAGCAESEAQAQNQAQTQTAPPAPAPVNWLDQARTLDRKAPRLLAKLIQLPSQTLNALERTADAVIDLMPATTDEAEALAAQARSCEAA